MREAEAIYRALGFDVEAGEPVEVADGVAEWHLAGETPDFFVAYDERNGEWAVPHYEASGGLIRAPDAETLICAALHDRADIPQALRTYWRIMEITP